MNCADHCESNFHIPAEVHERGTSCIRYNLWLVGQAKSCRNRDRGKIKPLPPLSEYQAVIHSAVVRSKGLDEYTGDPLEWNRINHERPAAGGRRNHVIRGRWPSVDHYQGTGKLHYRICSGLVNLAKGPLDHQQFVELCRKVTDKHSGWGKQGKSSN